MWWIGGRATARQAVGLKLGHILMKYYTRHGSSVQIKSTLKCVLGKLCAALFVYGQCIIDVLKKIKRFILRKLRSGALLNANSQPTFISYRYHVDFLSCNVKILAKVLAEELKVSRHCREVPAAPSVASLVSKACTQADLESGWCRYWIGQLQQDFAYHRKLWEQSFVSQVLYEHGLLAPGKLGLGLGCGEEPLPSLFLSRGCKIIAGDKPITQSDRVQAEWIGSSQYTHSRDGLYKENLVDRQVFDANLTLEYVDMNALPDSLEGKFDYCWSVCSLEHLGSIERGLSFLRRSFALLKPGGISVHTTEFNYACDGMTIDNWPTVLFQRKHFEQLSLEINKLGGVMLGPDFEIGNDVFDLFIDVPPYAHQPARGIDERLVSVDEPFLKLLCDGFPMTCFGVVLKKF